MLNQNELKEKILTIRSGNVLLSIIQEIGGYITRYCLKTEEQVFEILRPATLEEISTGNLLKKGCFPLVPFSNRIRNGRFSFQGQHIKMSPNLSHEVHTIHGQGWKNPWTVIKVEKNRAMIEYRHSPDDWPFAYLAHQCFELLGSALTVTLQITNCGKSAMPAGMGLHPYFVRTPMATITAKTEKMWINDFENMPLRLELVPETELLNQGLIVNQNVMDNIFTGWNREVLISWPEWNAKLKIFSYTPLDFIVIYTPAQEEFFCVEPVSNVTDAFNLMCRGYSGHGTKILLPGESFEGRVCFHPELF